MTCPLSILPIPKATLPPVWGPDLIVSDGLNTMWTNHYDLRLEVLLTVAADVLAHGCDLVVVSDSNTRYKVAEFQGPAHAEAYLSLLNHTNFFVETSGHTRADDLILPLAEMQNARIVSCDQFEKYEEFSTLTSEPGRLIKVHAIRDIVFLGKQQLRMECSLEKAMNKLESLLSTGPLY
jgi:hypothetical protein